MKFSNQNGTTAVEFAVIAALLFLIIFGILEFCILFMQEHYVANAAREGVRIGVRANNYDCFNGDSVGGCNVDRKRVVINEVSNYLSTIYSAGSIIKPNYNSATDIQRDPDENSPNTGKKTLSVTVEVTNIFPGSFILSLAGIAVPETISHTATGEYEDATEP